MTTTSSLLISARRSSGLTQEVVSRRSKIPISSLSNFENDKRVPSSRSLQFALLATGHQLVAAPYLGVTAVETASRAKISLNAGEPRNALRDLIQLSDDLGHARPEIKVVACIAEPQLTGFPDFDAGVAAICHLYLARESLPVPEWILSPSRIAQLNLNSFGVNWGVEFIAETDPVIISHGVIIPEETLASV